MDERLSEVGVGWIERIGEKEGLVVGFAAFL